MIDYISGTVAELQPTVVVIDNHGIGYEMAITLTTYDALLKAKAGETVKLWVSEVIREDAHLLNGFASRRERTLHGLLVNVTKSKKLTNVRASGSDEKAHIVPPIVFSLKEALEYIKADEYVEITPNHIRMRKIILDEIERKRVARAAGNAEE
ncbi:MAG: hypothetical protein IJU62_01025 [Muribaculaceae bacterium]|nr:hypothetical protein [Muribaculaceae bacterium]